MRGDFSRIRFNRGKSYTATLQQQGRVELDADANEQRFIEEFLRRSETIDVIGEVGGPVDDAGFQITVVNEEILIGPGRYYVDGLMCENLATLSYDAQPFLINPTPASTLLANLENSAAKGAVLQVYLEVWERLVTALDDPCLREPALGRADTTARVQTVWRVLAGVVTPGEFQAIAGSQLTPCCQSMYQVTPPVSTGMMCAQPSPASDDCGCEPVPAAGYQGIENQLYRVEIHQPGDQTAATFKWSRENGSVVSAITGISGSTLQLNSLGPDANLGYQVGQWVELTDDTYLFGEEPNQPGMLYQIQSIQPADLSVTLVGPVTPVDPTMNARMRRWDQTGPSATSTGIPVSAGPMQLEYGIEVTFNDGTYQSGDYWTIPARTATGQIDWPPCDSDGSQCQPPQSVGLHVAPLACIHLGRRRTAAGKLPSATPLAADGLTIDDCRRIFSPLTDLSPLAPAQAIHVAEISWINDDIMTLDQLIANGLVIVLDQELVSPVTGANFIVTIETVVLPPSVEKLQPGQLLPTALRTIAALDSEILVDSSVLSWRLPDDQVQGYQLPLLGFLDAVLLIGAAQQEWARVRIKLLGAAIFGKTPNGAPLYLDGKAFGQAALRQDGSTPRIDLQLPSGSHSTTSDFDGWFYLAPALTLVSVTVAYSELTILTDAGGNFIGVQQTGVPGQVDPTATVTVNYPAAVAATVTLAISGASGVGTVAGIPASVTIDPGQTSTAFPIYIFASPPYNTTYDFTITASLALAGNLPSSSPTAGFSVTGPPEPLQ
jgi:hypothetical protein